MSMKINIEVDEKKVRELVFKYIASVLGEELELKPDDVAIEVKSKQNYRSEWESAAFRAIVSKYQ
jgi:hypothetical protein